ncbi:DUF7302 family protein [Gordonia cholesterolivorans]|uniref:DUF7302 family protein n=1 Tax=Gordonia cholesterolivorans TaxID=559625 RepID=UPI003D15B15D
MRLRHRAHGVIANVDDERGKLMLAGPWELADKAAPRSSRRSTKKVVEDDAGSADS